MKSMSVRANLFDVIGYFDPIRLGFKQFTIDWIEELGVVAEDTPTLPSVDDRNHALLYDLDNIVDIMAPGPDRDFFLMCQTFARSFLNSTPSKEKPNA